LAEVLSFNSLRCLHTRKTTMDRTLVATVLSPKYLYQKEAAFPLSEVVIYKKLVQSSSAPASGVGVRSFILFSWIDFYSRTSPVLPVSGIQKGVAIRFDILCKPYTFSVWPLL
jgi:hypothetical protein